MMKSIEHRYPDLRFGENQIYFNDQEYEIIAKDFWKIIPNENLTLKDKAFIQGALFIAIDASEKANLLFSLFKSFITSAPSRSVKTLIRKLVQNGAKQAFSKYIDKDPKYSAIGRAAVQLGELKTNWQMRCTFEDTDLLNNFLK